MFSYDPIVMYGLSIDVELHCLLICLRSEVEVSITSPSFIALHLLVSEIAKCIYGIVTTHDYCGVFIDVYQVSLLRE